MYACSKMDGMHVEKETGRYTIQTNKQLDRETSRQTNRQADKQADRDRDRQACITMDIHRISGADG